MGMTDREKVIKGLECCAAMSGDECRECPYGHECRDTDLPYGMPHLAGDALTILKEQEAVKRTYRTWINGFSIIWTCGACGSDLHPNNAKAKYCSNCGKPVKWDD